ncbi:S8 family serine peptidase [Catellatospora sp. NPDC049609]|uniref:S8 family serine peptidase n=1 Tax=Catellatospora sp. NPDC049609 TaxID=3155505 RepID=UPI00344AC691
MTLPLSPRRLAAAAAILLAAATAATLTGVPALAASEGQILSVGTAAVVPDSYLVVLKDTVSRDAVTAKAEQLSARFGGRTGHTYRHAVRGFEVSMPQAAARRLAADPAVAYVQANGIHTATGTQSPTPSWGLDRIDQRNLPLNNSYTYPTTAAGVRAYIIDTGIRFTHNDFGGRAVTGFDAIDGGAADDGHGHGTHVAGTVGGTTYGVAKAVTLVGVRVLNNSGQGTTAQVVAGIDWVTGDHDPGELAVANMSLGGGVDTTLDNAVAASIADGITYGVAAGNNNGANACNTSPARTPNAITVGSTTSTDTRSSFSNIGTCLDIFAPGSSITSAWNTSNTATNTISGTSMATPHVVGAAALVLAQNPSYTPQQVRDYLVNNATSGVVTNPGTGSPNKLLYVVNGTAANDFTVTVAPASGSAAPGGSVTATVGTTTTSGSPQTVALSASGLPGGATASFSPASVTSGDSSTMTISTTASTPAGTYTVTVTGTGSVVRTASYTLTVTGGGGGCASPGQNLGNPGFESGSAPWTATSGVIGAFAGQSPHGGTRFAWLDGYGTTHTDTLTQTVTLPTGCTSYTLSFWLHIDTAETTTTIAYDTLRVQVRNSSGTVLATLATYSNLNKAAGYTQKSFNLAAYAGQSVQIHFLGIEDFSLQTSFVIDDTALNVS